MNNLEKIINNAWENKSKVNKNSDKSLIDAINHFSRIRKTKRKTVEHLKEFYIEESMSKYLNLLKELIT